MVRPSDSAEPNLTSTLDIPQIHINKLPPELLLRIFAIGDGEQRAKRKERERYYGFQDLAVQVCTRWRNVAISAPTLWTYIYISRKPPDNSDNSTALYLDRSRSTSLLDINLDMMGGSFNSDPESDNWSSKASFAKQIIEFLVKHGATIDRWKSLAVCSGVLQALYATLVYIHPQSAPSLRFLSLEWRHRTNLMSMQNETQSLAYCLIFDKVFPDTGHQLPRLRRAEFKSIPTNFLFRRPLPMLTGLTHLEFTPGFNLFSLVQLHTLLSANPHLESLKIGTGHADEDTYEMTDLQVALPSLRSLALSWDFSLSWALSLIRMINAPTVEHLKLSCYELLPKEVGQLARQLMDRISVDIDDGDDLPAVSSNSVPSRQHAYPTLKILDISGFFDASDDDAEVFRELFSALPTITCLVAPGNALVVLRDPPWLLPRLEQIEVFIEPPQELGDILHDRIDGGLPLQTIKIQEQYLDDVQGTLPHSLTVIKLPSATSKGYYDDDDEEEDDDDDEIDDDGFDDEGFDEGFHPGYEPDFDEDGLFGHDWLSDEEHDEEGYDDYDGYDHEEGYGW